MKQLWLVLILIGLGSIGVFGVLYTQLRKYKMVYAMFAGVTALVLALGFYLNPDLFRWYQHLQQQAALSQAKSILAEPKKMAMLKIRLQDVVELHPEDAKAWFLLGRLWAAENNWKQASSALEHAYLLNQKDLKTAIFYAESMIRVEQKMTPLARDVLLKVLNQEPEQPDALLMLAEDAVSRQCPMEAIEYWKRVLIAVPKDSEMYNILEEAMQKARQKDPSHCSRVQD